MRRIDLVKAKDMGRREETLMDKRTTPKASTSTGGAVSPHWLTDSEIDDLCGGLKQNASKRRFLVRALGIEVRCKANGAPLVLRSQIEMLGSKALKSPRSGQDSKDGPTWSIST